MAKMARPTSQSHRGEFTMTNRFPAGLLALAFSLIIALPAHAQDPPRTEEKGTPSPPIGVGPPQNTITPEKKALIKELLGLMNSGNIAGAIAIQFMEQFQQSGIILIKSDLREWIEAQKFAPAKKNRMEAEIDESAQRILTRLRAEFPKRINLGEILEIVALEVYDKYFTEAEVKDLIAFYKTPTGQKSIKILPQLSAEMLPRIGQLMDPAASLLAIELLGDEIKRLTGKQN
jgi:uncharacterized protein